MPTTRVMVYLRTFFIGVILGLIFVGSDIKNLYQYRDKAQSAWDQVQTYYYRRANLTPHLARTLKSSIHPTRPEHILLAQLVEAASQAKQAYIPFAQLNNAAKVEEFQNKQDRLTDILSRVFLVSERHREALIYPAFADLRTQFQASEERLQKAQIFYTQQALLYNEELHSFPNQWFAQLFYPATTPLQMVFTFHAYPSDASEQKQSIPQNSSVFSYKHRALFPKESDHRT